MAFGQPNYGYPQYGYQNLYQNQFSPNQFGSPMMQPQVGQSPVMQPITQPQQPSQQVNQQIPTIYGKVVDGLDVVKSLDIPIGMSLILPKASGETVYFKGWNADGTTFIKEYALVEEKESAEILPQIDWEGKLNEIYSSIDSLNKKIDKIKPAPTPRKKKVVEEVDEDYE